jgi:hypothetical protein
VLQQEPQPPEDFLETAAVPWPTSGVLPPERMKAPKIRLTSACPQDEQLGSVLSDIERSISNTSRHFWQRYS